MSQNYHELSDTELTGKVKETDWDAFTELSGRYLGLIRGKAAQFTGGSLPEKEDLLQEGVLGLYLAACSYKPEQGASFSTYAGVCVYNQMASAVRAHVSKKNRPLNESIPLETAGDAPADALESPEALVELQENFQGILLKLKHSLSPLEQKVLSWYLSGCKRQDIPEKTGLSLKTFDNALHRVRKKMKNL